MKRAGVRRGVGMLLIALLFVAVWGLRGLTIDNGIERWVDDDLAAERYARFVQDFGGDTDVFLVYHGRDLFTEEALDQQLAVLEAIEAVPGVGEVRSLPSLFRDHFGAESVADLQTEIGSSPFYERLIVSPDHTIGGMIIHREGAIDAGGRQAWLDQLATAARPMAEAGWTLRWVGPDVVNVTLDRASDREARRLLPVAMAASAGVLLLMLRSWRGALAAWLVSLLTVAATLGLMGWWGLTINLVTVALPPVLWVLATAYMVHLLRYHETARCGGATPEEALRTAVARSTRPSVLAALTTALGFLSLCTAKMAPVRELGLAGAWGILIALVVALGLGPVLIRLLRIQPSSPARPAPRAPGAATPLYARRPGTLILGALALTGLSLIFATGLRIESNPLTFLDPETPLVKDAAFVAENFSGLYTLESVLELPGSWLDPANWPAIEAQAAALAQAEGVARVVSPLDYLRKLGQWRDGGDPAAYQLPECGDDARALMDAMPETALRPLKSLASAEGNQVRLSSLVREMDGAALLEILRQSEEALAAAPGGVSGYHTGVVLRLVRAQFGLIETQLNSLGLALGLVFLCIALGARSLRILIYSIAPNVLPVAALFGIMGAFHIPLDPATVMVAAIVVGLAVDDTLHLLSTWEEETRAGSDGIAALHGALAVNRPAMVATTLTASAGFATLGLSAFAPIRYFGLLATATLAIALAFDLLLLPASMVVGERLLRGKPL